VLEGDWRRVKKSKKKRGGLFKVSAPMLVALLVAVFPVFGLINAGVAGADSPTTGFYLDLGASASVGIQPTISDPRGQLTANGYSNDLVAYESARGVTLHLTELGCPGESTVTMMNGGDRCYPYHDTQFEEALTFLRSHQTTAGIVTIDLGFNNVRRCLANQTANQTCVKYQIRELRQQLPTILEGLKNVAGPNVTFVGLGHYDPFLADALLGPAGAQFAAASATTINRLNAALQSIYTDAGVPMATVGAAFESRDVAQVLLTGKGMVPENVAQTCVLTWMCQAAPYGPNLHPNDHGYATIAAAIESVLKAPW
jgi:hypothetical protein